MENVFITLFLICLVSTIAVFKWPARFLRNKSEKEAKNAKIGLVIFTVAFFVLFGVTSDTNKTKTGQPLPNTESATPTQVKTIDYEVIKTWEIPNGGFGKVVVISPENFNETDIALLGEKLKSDTKKDRNAFIFIYNDKKAAEMRDRLSSTTNPLTKEEEEYYDIHYVGEYSRNINSGYHQLTIYFDGVMGSNQKTIQY